MPKKLSIAFLWHMHQPTYQPNYHDIFLMPWVRLHAVKDYLDMLLIMDKFPNLKLNFNLVPLLLSAFDKYSNKEAHDLHSKLTVTDIHQLSDEEKHFILNKFFDVNYHNMISHHEQYDKLYKKRYLKDEADINDFSTREYSDIMMWFNLAWMDPIWKDYYPRIQAFLKKAKGYSLEDRIELIEIHRNIISKIIPTYKKYSDDGKIELSTSPYYHCILPLLIDMNCAKDVTNKYQLPKGKFDMKKDAIEQTKWALDLMESTFGKRPKGIWPSEQCVSDKTLDMLSSLGVQWTISDEGVLANSLGREFVRDFKGYLADPFDLCNSYEYKNKNKSIKVIFRNATASNLISFEYPHHDSVLAANDLYERIKSIQHGLKNSPDSKHLLTIAMDGENSWENYYEDGTIFLETLYRLICEDKTLETVLISDYLDNDPYKKPLKSIHAGSWINRNFQLWVAEPVKNLAWEYLDAARCDLAKFEKEKSCTKEQIANAKREIYVSQGSDWFWWYGEPNDSGQDHVFDFLFREHLKNVYTFCDKPFPAYLDHPLTSFESRPARYPKGLISPKINGKSSDIQDWQNAGCIDINAGPIIQENKLFNRICFGCDYKNIYLKFDINKYPLEKKTPFHETSNIFIYFKVNKSKYKTAPIRTLNREDFIVPILKESFTHELNVFFSRNKNKKLLSGFAFAIENNLWATKLLSKVKCNFNDALELSVPFDDLDMKPGTKVDLVIINGAMGKTEEVYPQDMMMSLTRPEKNA